MIRNYRPSDAERVRWINETNVPEVGPMDEAKLELLLAESPLSRVVVLDDVVEGFLIVLQEGGSYGSPNYAWFSERYASFAYVDRIALTPATRGQGWGVQLYDHAAAFAQEMKKAVLVAEVNTVPANPRSLHFHFQFGFAEIGREKPYGGEEEVAMLARPVVH